MDASVLARDHVERNVATVERLHAVGADVHPGGIEVARDHGTACADIAPAVELVPQRRGKGEHIHRTVPHYVLQGRSGFRYYGIELRRFRLPLSRFAAKHV